MGLSALLIAWFLSSGYSRESDLDLLLLLFFRDRRHSTLDVRGEVSFVTTTLAQSSSEEKLSSDIVKYIALLVRLSGQHVELLRR
jgi:hypothetical protein